ncbi:MAG: MFS transporter, partial [Gaiellaceae bacterium]
ITLFGLVSLAGSAAAPRLQRLLGMRAIVVGSYWLQLTVVAFLFYPNVYVLLVSFLPAAFFGPTLNAVVIGYRVAITPDHLTGRVNGVARTIAICGAPLGPLAAGFLLGSFSARTTIGVFTVVIVLLTMFATISSSIRNAPSLRELEPVIEPPVFPEAVG